MSKGLEAFMRVDIHPSPKHKSDKEFLKDYNIIEKELQRLESIDNANPSEAINCLHTIAFNTQFTAGMNFGNELRAIEQALLKSQEKEKENELLLAELKELEGSRDYYKMQYEAFEQRCQYLENRLRRRFK